MDYKTILVNLDIDGPVVPIITAAADLAERFQAKLIGFCAADAPLLVTGVEGGELATEAWQMIRKDIARDFERVRGEFEKIVGGKIEAHWRDSLEGPSQGLARAARFADLIVVSASEGAATGDAFRTCNPGSVVLQAGRPILIAAKDADRMLTKRVTVAWKDTREARRAVADAVPLLAAAEEVDIVAIAGEIDIWLRESLSDVASFLAGHGIKARTHAIEGTRDSNDLISFLKEHRTDLVVSGAYGHSRLREWVFGGVTRSLIDQTDLNRFFSN
ncbi:universal stress protein [Mesorhizobium retamae]|uniref:Universal stress protein n=1 Tax=Mesorhizobium retamae TaxID=2912854 RepID=A0ABS9QF70_9HYPH|nr:universal stress protein [Mesorhizobium sp. IRAMC:0171]MCG7506065.1 universal stress protein [Mesorhizobium sp. IRAMC:0171]